MDQGFINILKQIVKEQGNAALFDPRQCKALLTDYTKNEYKREVRFILIAVEAGMAKAIVEADNLEACKKAKIRDLDDEYALDTDTAEDIINTLALILRGDTTRTLSPLAANAAPAPAPLKLSPAVSPISAPPKKQSGAGVGKSKIPFSKKVELKSVTKVYDGVRAVDDVNMIVGDKEFVVLLGPPGSGKSTLLNLIAGHEKITRGELYIDGELMNNFSAKDRSVAMVAEDYAEDRSGSKLPVLDIVHSKSRLNRGALSFQMTVYENMAYDLRNYKVPKVEIDRRVNEAARILDVEKLLNRKPPALSRGQRWRVALGRAIVRNPKVFLLDDPLSGIDAKNHASTLRANLRDELLEMHRRLNATILFATGDRDEANLAMADRVIEMKDGRVL